MICFFFLASVNILSCLIQEDTWYGSWAQAQDPPQEPEVGWQSIQEEPLGQWVEKTLCWIISRQGHRSGEDVCQPWEWFVLLLSCTLCAWAKVCCFHCVAVLRPSSQTLPSVSAPVFSWWRMGRRLLPLCRMMVAWTTLRRMYMFLDQFSLQWLKNLCNEKANHLSFCRMRCWLLDSVARAMLWEIFLVSGSRLWRYLVCRCLHSSRRRRRSQGLRFLSIVKNGVNCQGSIIKLKVVLATEMLVLSCIFC